MPTPHAPSTPPPRRPNGHGPRTPAPGANPPHGLFASLGRLAALAALAPPLARPAHAEAPAPAPAPAAGPATSADARPDPRTDPRTDTRADAELGLWSLLDAAFEPRLVALSALTPRGPVPHASRADATPWADLAAAVNASLHTWPDPAALEPGILLTVIPAEPTDPADRDEDHIADDAEREGERGPAAPAPAAAASAPAASLAAVVDLVDGQRLIGLLVLSGDFPPGPRAEANADTADNDNDKPDTDADVLRLLVPPLGALRVPLDRVSAVRLDVLAALAPAADAGPSPEAANNDAPSNARPPRDTPAPADSDELVLRNGDRLRGFIAAVGPSVTVELDSGDARVPLRNIAELRFANPAVEPTGTYVWLSNGAVLAGTLVQPPEAPPASAARAGAPAAAIAGSTTIALRHADSVGPRPGVPRPLPLNAREIAAVLPQAERVRPLASLGDPAVTPDPARRWTPAPAWADPRAAVLNAASLEVPGPMTLRWRLPADASRFAADLRLGATRQSPDRRPGPWADARVQVRCLPAADTTGPILADLSLSAASPTARVNVALPAGPGPRDLVITLLPAAHGPVQDHLLIQSPLLRLDP